MNQYRWFTTTTTKEGEGGGEEEENGDQVQHQNSPLLCRETHYIFFKQLCGLFVC